MPEMLVALWRRMEIRWKAKRPECSAHCDGEWKTAAAARIFSQRVPDTNIIGCSSAARGSVAASRDARSVRSVVAKHGGQEESEVLDTVAPTEKE